MMTTTTTTTMQKSSLSSSLLCRHHLRYIFLKLIINLLTSPSLRWSCSTVSTRRLWEASRTQSLEQARTSPSARRWSCRSSPPRTPPAAHRYSRTRHTPSFSPSSPVSYYSRWDFFIWVCSSHPVFLYLFSSTIARCIG